MGGKFSLAARDGRPTGRFREQDMARRRRLVMLALLVLGPVALTLGTGSPGSGETMDRQEIRQRLEAHLHHLSVTLGDRSLHRPGNLKAAEDYVFQNFAAMGYAPRRQAFRYLEEEVANVIAGDEHPGGYYILGAHFDTVAGTPGADDNASGVAVLLEVARLARNLTPPKPWAFIGFTLEEPPAFSTPAMGSRVYAQAGPPATEPGFSACSAWRWWAITPRPRTASRSPCP